MSSIPDDLANDWHESDGLEGQEAKANARNVVAAYGWLKEQPGLFKSADLERELGLTVDERQWVIAALLDWGKIVPVGQWRGCYRAVDAAGDEIDWRNPQSGDYLQIRWPLRLQDRFGVLPGSVIVVAGESNAGKTAFMLNLAVLNNEQWPHVNYFASSNESNAITLRKRIEAFDLPLEEWANFRAIRPRGEFADIIEPEGFNLIDYLEIHDDFYLVGQKLAAIAERLTTGVAVVGLQKNPGSEYGRGGALTQDKAVAYLSLIKGDHEKGEAHTLKLLKLKYPVGDGAYKPIKFKLVGGHNFVRADY